MTKRFIPCSTAPFSLRIWAGPPVGAGVVGTGDGCGVVGTGDGFGVVGTGVGLGVVGTGVGGVDGRPVGSGLGKGLG